jgi:hypothetical protein
MPGVVGRGVCVVGAPFSADRRIWKEWATLAVADDDEVNVAPPAAADRIDTEDYG